jgi:two-component system alkaline phosphatase synthesis response regulator PhoP/two-component system response regulator VicR
MPERKKILAVDDDKFIVMVIRVNLEFEGYEVVEAYDGVQALEMIESENPDLVVLDIMMPEMNGWDVLSRIRENPKTEDLPVIMLTALAQDRDIEEATLRGADVYLTKPFEPEELILTVKRMLAMSDDQLILEEE